MIVWLWEALVALAAPVIGQNSPPSLALRAALAAAFSCLTVLAIGPRCVAWLGARFGERVASPSADIQRLHAHKTSTPTMGGLFILAALLLSVGMFGDCRNRLVWIAALALIGFAAVGLADDLRKLSAARRGLSARGKLVGQLAVGLLATLALHGAPATCSSATCSLATWPSAAAAVTLLVIVGSSNAVNLTDGLDGLAGGCLACSFAALAVVCLVSGRAEQYALGASTPAAREMAVIAAAACGAVIGFLRFNAHPAVVFMGDTGALSLGALLGFVAVAAHAELALALVGGVFVVETLSVILQVASFRATGRRIFLCAPLHHHYQLRGWTERKVVTRFWLFAALCGGAGVLAAIVEARLEKPHPAPLAVARRGG